MPPDNPDVAADALALHQMYLFMFPHATKDIQLVFVICAQPSQMCPNPSPLIIWVLIESNHRK